MLSEAIANHNTYKLILIEAMAGYSIQNRSMNESIGDEGRGETYSEEICLRSTQGICRRGYFCAFLYPFICIDICLTALPSASVC